MEIPETPVHDRAVTDVDAQEHRLGVLSPAITERVIATISFAASRYRGALTADGRTDRQGIASGRALRQP